MTAVLGPLMLTTATGAMLALPLTPAFLEVRRRRDAAPIPIQQHDGDIRNFASSFRRHIDPLLAALEPCCEQDEVQEIRLENGACVLLSGCAGAHRLSPRMHGARIDALVLCGKRVVLGESMIFTSDFYAADSLFGGKANIFRAVLGEKDVFLGENSQVLRWLHAEDAVYGERNSRLYGRLSAGRAIYLWPGCGFERVRAPRIATVWGETGFPVARSGIGSTGSRLDHPVRRWRVDGEFQLRRDEELRGNLIAQGEVRIGERCRVLGAIKSHGETVIASEAEIDGSIVSTSTVRVGSECFIRGPVLAEREIVIGPGTQIGSPELHTTVSAPRIRVAPGSLVHGTLWARESGRVEV